MDSSLLIFLAILSILIVVHEFGHFIVAKKLGVRVERFSVGFGPKLISRKRKDTEYTLCAIPLGGFVKLAGDSLSEFHPGKQDEYYAQSPGRRFQIVFFGPLLNYLLGIVCFWFIFVVGYPQLTTKVGGLVDGFGAQKAGILAGDRITAIDSVKVTYWEDLQKIVQSKTTTDEVKVDILRNDTALTLNVPIRAKAVDDELGKKRRVGLIGIIPAEETVTAQYGVIHSLRLAFTKSWDLTVITYKAIWRMITGQLSVKESVTGPLGMFFITRQVASLGVIALVHFLATLSISLCLFNLLPIPALDGGHLFLLALEKLRGRGLSVKTEHTISHVGFTLIIALALFITYNDILRLFGAKIAQFFK